MRTFVEIIFEQWKWEVEQGKVYRNKLDKKISMKKKDNEKLRKNTK
jgi:hypothetical protein